MTFTVNWHFTIILGITVLRLKPVAVFEVTTSLRLEGTSFHEEKWTEAGMAD